MEKFDLEDAIMEYEEKVARQKEEGRGKEPKTERKQRQKQRHKAEAEARSKNKVRGEVTSPRTYTKEK